MTIASPFADLRPPAWASGFGQDEFGYYADYSVPTGEEYWEFVSQRFRWIPPDTFMMGSREDENGRFEDEIRRQVTLETDFWLADTACSQSLWQAVQGDNPSRFKGDKNPVERVSFEHVRTFIEKLNTHEGRATFGLPTEAQWEYACRAGTKTAFSFGETITTQQVNYSGRFGHGEARSGEYREKTVSVKSLQANAWGLYEMHGNVWEWCSDLYGPYDEKETVNPVGSGEGSDRVVRGGSWFSYARVARSASRYWYAPGNRGVYLGFRLLSSASQVQQQQAAEQESASSTE